MLSFRCFSQLSSLGHPLLGLLHVGRRQQELPYCRLSHCIGPIVTFPPVWSIPRDFSSQGLEELWSLISNALSYDRSIQYLPNHVIAILL